MMVVVMMMMMVVMITPECSEGRSDHDAGSPVVVMMVMVMVMVVMVVVLRQLDVAFLRGPALLLIHRLQQRACIRDRL
jgi:ABC-type transport system involved in cytochrome c biogenesis permease subunit